MNKKVEFLEYEYTEKLDLIKIKSLVLISNCSKVSKGTLFASFINNLSLLGPLTLPGWSAEKNSILLPVSKV